MFRASRALAFVCCATSVLFVQEGSALAQSDDTARRAAAQVLFDDAIRLIQQRDFARACPKLEEVIRLQPGKIGAMLELAECYEAWGKTASAWARYRMASDLAAKAGDARKADADAKAAALEPAVSRLLIVVPESMRWVGGLVIERDGAPLGAATWGAAMPVDPGAHEISASAPNKKRWSSKVEINRPGATITVTVPVLEDAPKPSGAASPVTPRNAGFVVGAFGLVGIGIGSIFGLQAMSNRDQASRYCGVDSCTTKGHVLEQQAFGNATVSTAAFIAGGTLLAGGVVMVFWPTSKPAAGGSPAARVVAGPGSISLQGAW